jgi:adenine-specific DNA glycosylase
MAGLWELPGGEIDQRDEAKDRLAEVVRKEIGLDVHDPRSVGRVEHVFTHRRLELEIFHCRADKGDRVKRNHYQAHRWIRPIMLLDLAHAGPTRKAMALLGVTAENSARAAGRRKK